MMYIHRNVVVLRVEAWANELKREDLGVAMLARTCVRVYDEARRRPMSDHDPTGDATEAGEARLAVRNERPERPVFASDGTDLTLIREMLAKSPEERIRTLEATIESIHRLRDAIDS